MSEPERERPWAAWRDEEKHGHWSDYAAWQAWLDAAAEAMVSPPIDTGGGHTIIGFDPSGPRESLDYQVEIGLYVLMCKLADGAPIDAPCPERTAS